MITIYYRYHYPTFPPSLFFRVLLIIASGELVKESKNSKFYIEKYITYALKMLATQVPRQFYQFW
jgi:hypothetical protein